MSELTLLDICLRFLCLGQLLFFLAWVVAESLRSKRFTFEKCLLSMLLVCCMSAVVLTMYYRPPLIYAMRPVLLAFTDGLSFVFWMYVVFSLSDAQPSISRSPWLRMAGIAYFLWHLYFFVINEGQGWFHDAIHVVAGLAVLHVIIHSVATWRDDLVDSRRRRRAIFLVAACVLLLIYVVSEVSDIRFMRSEFGSLIGASLMLSLSLSLGIFHVLGLVSNTSLPEKVKQSELLQVSIQDIPPQYQALYQQLIDFMSNQGFTESRLTLSRLAERLGSKEHRLRAIINQNLGYRNFSSYLNDHRLPLACQWLQNKPEQAIIDIALDLGYGSITSFNRAFKSTYGVAPREYRVSRLEKQ